MRPRRVHVVRRRSARRTGMHRTPAAGRIRFGPAFAEGPVGALPAAGPHLKLPEPESRRAAIVSGSLTALLHAATLGVVVWLAWVAAPDMEKIIPVKILKELPGSNEEPAPAPKALAPRRPVAAAAVSRPLAPVEPAPVEARSAAPVPAEALELDRVDPAAAPTEIARREVASRRVDARQSVNPARVRSPALAPVSPVRVDRSQLTAPRVELGGPRRVADSAQVDVPAPQVFARLGQAPAAEYTGETASGPAVEALEAGAYSEGISIDTDVAAQYLGGEGTGGTGSALGVVRCEESAFVDRYLRLIQERTYRQWNLPGDAPSEARVVLRFELDHSGSATKVEFIEAATPALGDSAVQALRSASPFPPMGDDVRCLAGKPLIGRFFVESH